MQQPIPQEPPRAAALPPILDRLSEALRHRIDPAVLREVGARPIDLEEEGPGTLDALSARAERVGLRMVRTLMSSVDLVRAPAHHLPLLIERPDGGVVEILATRGLRARARWADGEAWLAPRALARLAGAEDERELVIAMGAELALPLTGGAPSAGETHGGGGGAHGHGGVERLLSLLRLERSDLFSIVVYAVFIGLSTLVVPVAVQAVVNTVAFGALVQPLVVLTVLVLGFLVLNGLLRALQVRVVERLQERLFVRVATEFAHRLPRVRVGAFDRVYAPEKVNRFFDVLTAQKAATGLLLDGLGLVLSAVVGMILLGFYHPFLLAFDVVLILAVATIVFGFGRGAVPTSLDESAAKYDLVAWLEDVARGPVAFRMNPEAALDRADDLARRYLGARRRHFSILFRQIVGAVALQAVASAALLAIGGLLVLRGQLTVGQLVAAELVVTSVVAGVAKLGKHLESYYDLRTALEKLGSVTDLPLERTDALRSLPKGAPARLRLASVRFAHEGRPPVHDGLSFELRSGERLALLGEHGAGKSTVADLVYGLRDAGSGAILLDGVDVRELSLSELRRHVALVRDVEIFEGSILENVSLWRKDVTAVDVARALEAVGLSATVSKLPEGVKTQLQTGGTPLSLGEAQRLVLARALAGRPRLLVIDGLLDGLADASLVELEQRLDSVCRDRTSMLVLTSVEAVASWCDRSIRLGRRTSLPSRPPTGEVPS